MPATRKTATEEDRGENNKDPGDWLIEQSIARQVARGREGAGGVRNAEKDDNIVEKDAMVSQLKTRSLKSSVVLPHKAF